MAYKGFIRNKKKGSLSTVTEADVFVTDKPDKDTIYTHPDKTWLNKTNLTGPDVISNLSIDAKGHPTDWSVRALTPADIGASPLGHTHDFDKYNYWRFGVNNDTAEFISSGETVRFYPGDLIELEQVGNTVRVHKLPKPVYHVTGDTSIVAKRYFNNRWINVNTSTDPIITIDKDSTTVKGNELEGDFTGTGRMTIVGGVGVTLIYPDEYFTNTYPAGAVWGVKFISSTEAVLFGKQIPIGL